MIAGAAQGEGVAGPRAGPGPGPLRLGWTTGMGGSSAGGAGAL